MTFEQMKAVAEAYKMDIAKYSGMLQQIESGWQNAYGTSDVEKIKAILADKQAELQKLRDTVTQLSSQCEAIINDIESSKR